MNNNTTVAGIETPGHHLLEAPSFPEGSIADDGSGAWRCRTLDFAHYRSDDGGTYVGLRPAQRIWQDVELPVGAPVDEERSACVLGCRYNATWFDECTLTVFQLEGDQEQAELYRKPMRGSPPDPQTPVLADPTWHELTPDVVAIPSGVQRIRVVLETADTPQAALLYVRDVRLTWRLPAFDRAAQIRLIVDPQGASIEQTAPPFKLCHGAAHRLEVKAAAGDAWAGQKASLHWRSTGGGLPVEYGVTATPAFNIDDGDQEDRYQVMSSTTPAAWQLLADSDLPALPDQLSVGLGSYWHAPRHELELSIGDARYVVAEAEWDGVVPIIGENNSTVLTATLSNPFAPARWPQGKEVVWLLDGREYQRTISNANGEAQLRYSPKAGEQGADNRVEFTATCVDGLGQRSQQVLNLPVFEETPWEELEVLLDGIPLAEFEGQPAINIFADTHDLLFRPRRSDSYFVGKPVRLQWPDDGEPQRGISFTPTTEQTMTAQGIHWTLQSGGECGDFLLEAVQASLGAPLSLAGAQLSTELADHVELRLDDEPVKPDDLRIFRRGTPRKLQLMPKAASPLAQGGFEAWLTFIDDSFAEDGLKSEPAYGHKRALDSRGLEWVLTGHDISGEFTLQCHVERLRTSLTLTNNVLLSGNANDDFEFWSIDGTPDRFEAGRVNKIGLRPTFMYREGLPMYGRLFFLPGSVSSADAFPCFGVWNHLLLQWQVEPYGQGRFTLQAEVQGYDQSVTMDCIALPLALEDELALTFDGVPVEHDDVLNMTDGQAHQVGIVPRQGSSLGEAKLLVALEYHVMDKPGELNVVITPPGARELTADGLKWSVKANGQAGTHLKLRFIVSDADPTLELGAVINNA